MSAARAFYPVCVIRLKIHDEALIFDRFRPLIAAAGSLRPLSTRFLQVLLC